jgi:hypothetical protein
MSCVMPGNDFVAQRKDKGRTDKGRQKGGGNEVWIDKGKCDDGLKKLRRKKSSAFDWCIYIYRFSHIGERYRSIWYNFRTCLAQFLNEQEKNE